MIFGKRDSLSWLRSACFLWFVFACLVAFAASCELVAANPGGATHHQPIFCPSSLSKGIRKSDFSIDVDNASSISNRRSLLSGEQSFCRCGADTGIVGAEGHSCAVGGGKFALRDGQIECGRGWVVIRSNSAHVNHVIRWSLSGIFDGDDGFWDPNSASDIGYLGLRNEYVRAQLAFGRGSGVSGLAQYDNDKENSRDAKKESEQSYGIIDRLVDQPRKAGLISVVLGILTGTVGITLYLNRSAVISRVGLAFVCLGMFTPLFPWWLLILIWGAGQ
jgi:hypothetical protein